MLPALSPLTAGYSLRVLVPAQTSMGTTYAPEGGYSLTLALRGPGSLTLTADATQTENGAWLLQATPEQTAALPAGLYAVVWVASHPSGTRATLGDGQITVRPDLSAATQGYDPRTTAQMALEQAEAALASFKGSSGRIREYTIAGRTVRYDTAAELLQVVNYWRTKVQAERNAAAVAQGLGNPSTLRVRFGGAA